jgi:hypothetical protein
MSSISVSPVSFCVADMADDILFAEFKNVARIDLHVAHQLVSERLALTQQKKHYIVADASNVRHVTSEAMKFFESKDGGMKNILGAAIIASNPVSALFANIFIKKPKDFPARFFSNKRDALAWIRVCRQKHLALHSTT